jgi:Tfp pilus assembly protein PilN
MAALDKELAAVAREQSQVSQALARPENAAALNETAFLNALIQRKAVSWTQIFADLETVLPHNVRVISVRPQIAGDNQVQLDLFVGSQTTEPVIQMLMNLESSPVFGKTAIANWLPPSQTEPFYRYRLTVNYAQKL